MAPPSSAPVKCSKCNKTISRRADLSRHMKTHATNREELEYPCPHKGCTYSTIQRSNLKTHLNVHTRQRPYTCPTKGCDFSTPDPGSLTRHRKAIHGYVPKTKSRDRSTSVALQEARQTRRVSHSPYPPPISPDTPVRSVSPLDASLSLESMIRNIPPRTLLSALLAVGNMGERDVKNIFAAYNTDLIARINGSKSLDSSNTQFIPQPGSMTTPEIPAFKPPHQPWSQHVHQGDFYACTDLPGQMLPQAEVTAAGTADQVSGMHEQSFPPSDAAPTMQHTVSHTASPSPALLPPYGYGTDDSPLSTPGSLPAYEEPYPEALLNGIANEIFDDSVQFDDFYKQPLPLTPPSHSYAAPAVQSEVSHTGVFMPQYEAHQFSIDHAPQVPTPAAPLAYEDLDSVDSTAYLKYLTETPSAPCSHPLLPAVCEDSYTGGSGLYAYHTETSSAPLSLPLLPAYKDPHKEDGTYNEYRTEATSSMHYPQPVAYTETDVNPYAQTSHNQMYSYAGYMKTDDLGMQTWSY